MIRFICKVDIIIIQKAVAYIWSLPFLFLL